jgi:hypothetical protein
MENQDSSHESPASRSKNHSIPYCWTVYSGVGHVGGRSDYTLDTADMGRADPNNIVPNRRINSGLLELTK